MIPYVLILCASAIGAQQMFNHQQNFWAEAYKNPDIDLFLSSATNPLSLINQNAHLPLSMMIKQLGNPGSRRFMIDDQKNYNGDTMENKFMSQPTIYSKLENTYLDSDAHHQQYKDENESFGDKSDKQQELNSLKRFNEIFLDNNAKRSALRNTVARRSHKTREAIDDQFVPAISVGALTNLRAFFDNVKNNLESLEAKTLTPNQVKFLSSEAPPDNFKTVSEYVEDPHIKPSGTAAFLHAIRTYRPSHRVRALVSMQPDQYRGANFQYGFK